MARERKREKRSDETYNARRRFIREAERMLAKADKAVGQTRNRYRGIAREAISKAAELYERRGNIQRSGMFTRLANELGVNLDEFMQSTELAPREVARVAMLESQSLQTLGGEKTRREREAQAILNSPVGSRIYGGLVDVWAQPKYENGELIYRRSREDINRAIMDYFGVDSMMDVIEMLEKQIPALYADPESLERYDEISLAIMRGVIE